jgi:glycosidase
LSFFDKSTPIDWSINPDLTEEYKRIIDLRNESNAIRRGDLQSFSDDDVCAFTKSKGDEEVLVIVNLRSTPSAYTVPDSLKDNHWKDAYTGADATVPSQLDLQPYQYHVYKGR